ncbi:MAG: RNA ligase (ATP) [Propionibacteriaceae bacterium]|jgi:RNA ligase (TIGR02306 family)|nr:RNA ligase (ATP) [Propionibacteriaceae bacterium]
MLEDMRHLASLETIRNLRPIPDADAIEVGSVRGWDIVVRKGEFTAGDAVLFVEPDAALPLDDPRFEFLRPRGCKTIDGQEYHVLKTARLRGQLSQGIVFPASQFAELTDPGVLASPGEGQGINLDAILGIVLYEPPLPAGAAGIIGPWDIRWLKKSDAERVQNLSDEWLRGVDDGLWRATTKIDGSSHTVLRDGDQLRVYGRNWQIDATNPNTAVYREIVSSRLLEWMADHQIDAVQGELFGEGIQSNRQGIKRQRFAVFAAWRNDNGSAADRLAEAMGTAAAYGLYVVPSLDIAFPQTIKQALEQADALSGSVTPGKRDEGIVWHHLGQRYFPDLDGRIVFKAVSNKYLLKHGL